MSLSVAALLLASCIPFLLAMLAWAAMRERQLRRRQREEVLRAPERAAGYLVDPVERR